VDVDTERWLKMIEPLMTGTAIKLYIVRSVRRDWPLEPGNEVTTLAWKVRARHTDIDSSNKADVERLLKEVV
jgi:hypothetical protein